MILSILSVGLDINKHLSILLLSVIIFANVGLIKPVHANITSISAFGETTGEFNRGESVPQQQITFTVNHDNNNIDVQCRLEDPNGNVKTRTCDQQGSIVYPESDFDIDGTYTFTASESPTGGSLNTNTETFTFSINENNNNNNAADILDENLPAAADVGAGTATDTKSTFPATQQTINRAPNNPPWTTCAASSTFNDVDVNGADVSIRAKLNLVTMIYKIIGTTNLDEITSQANHDNTRRFLLQVESNFLNYMRYANLRSQESADDDGDKIAFKVEATDTNCKYQAPTLAVGLDISGSNVQGTALAFALSNPPFLKCTNSQGALYNINFGMSQSDFNKLRNKHFSDHERVKIEITQVVGGNNLVRDFLPKYSGKLITNPGQNNENSYDLIIERGTNLYTECIAHTVQ